MESPSSWRRFASELKRRKVYRVAVTYAVVSFVTLQAAALIFPATTLEGIYDVLVVVAFVGFPIAVVLAWAFELTPEGVRRVPEVGEEERPEADDGPVDRPPGPALGWRGVMGIALLLAAAVYGSRVWIAEARDGITEEEARPATIAVLPFASLSPASDDEYFATGLSDELIHSLARIGGLQVTGRTSAFALGGRGLEARQIADSLGVAHLLEGSVRRSDGRLRVTAQLVDARSGFELWSGRFERPEGEVLVVQDSIVRAIVDALQVELGSDEHNRIRKGPARTRPADPEAYELYMKGRHVWLQRGDLERALELFRQAADLDPTFARAWAGMADAFTILGSRGRLPAEEAHNSARAAARRALELDPDLGEAHVSMAAVLADYDWDWAAAERHYRQAVELAPSYATARQWQAELLLRHGRFEEAIAAARTARRLDPLSEPARASLIHALRVAGRHDEALKEARRQRQVSPGYAPGHLNLGLVLLTMGAPREAAEELEAFARATGRESTAISLLGAARARAGDTAGARELLDELRGLESRLSVAPILPAYILAALGEEDAALDSLERGLVERHWLMGTLAVDPFWDPLRDHRRFRALLEKMKLPVVTSDWPSDAN